jgi:uncharacterized protein YuzE
MKTSYDPSTDSLYIELRPLPAAWSREIMDDVVVDIGQDGEPIGYDIQHASEKAELVGRIIVGQAPERQRAAE